MNKWIPVSERLPGEETSVWATIKDDEARIRSVRIAFYSTIRGWTDEGNNEFSGFGETVDTKTFEEGMKDRVCGKGKEK